MLWFLTQTESTYDYLVFQGDTCEKDVNECAVFAGTDLGCQNGATCINKAGSYE